MQRIPFACLVAVLAAVVSLSAAAQAQVTTQKYASPAGGGADCSASSPCSLDTAILLVEGAGGIVSCIDGGFHQAGVLNVTGSFTVDCPGAVLTPVGVATWTLTGTSSQVVILRNLTFDGAGQQGAPFLKVTGGTTLIIENCRFQNIANNNAIAIQFLPTSPAAQLIIRDSAFLSNGIAPGTGGGLQVAPTGSGSASVKLERVSFEFNVTSMVLSGPVNATMINSSVSSSRSNGILVGSGSSLLIEGSTLEYNVGPGVSVTSGGTLRLSNDTIESNQTGISNSGGHALTYANNRIFGNGSTATLTQVQGGQ
jgi:hypothetical protein